MSGYTLKQFFEEARLPDVPRWAGQIELRRPKDGAPMKPYWCQVQALNQAFLYPNGRSGVYDEMGTGKTLIGGAFLVYHAALGNPGLGIMPPNLLPQFRDSLLNGMPGIEKHVSIAIYHGTVAQKNKMIGTWMAEGFPDIILTTPDVFREEAAMFKDVAGRLALLADEADWLGNPDNKTSTMLDFFMGKEGDRASMIMTGTPAGNCLTQLFGFINHVTPGVYSGFHHFTNEHVTYEQFTTEVNTNRGIKKIRINRVKAINNEEKLYQSLYLQGRRIEKRQIMELPNCEVLEHPYKLSTKHKKMYDQLVDEKLIIFPEDNTMIDGTNASTIRNICMQAVMDPTKLRVNEESEAIKELRALINQIGPRDHKIFITAYYRATVEQLAEVLKEFNPAVIYGKTPSKNPKEKLRFINDPTCRVLIANYESGGVGLDGLQDVCHYGIAAEPTTVPGQMQQAIARLDRGGQKTPVTWYLMYAERTIHAKSIRNRDKKKNQINRVVSRLEFEAELKGFEIKFKPEEDEDGLDFDTVGIL